MTRLILAFLVAFTARTLGQTNQGLKQDLSQFLQPNTVGDVFNPGFGGANRCDRTCVVGGKPRLCYYKFTIENYSTMGGGCGLCPLVQSDCFKPQCITADGFERGLYAVNRRMPGPSIQVCYGDRIVVDVMNMMPGKSTTIHFHGILQENSNFMDGVPMVTQCPINEGQTYRYNFLANTAGTHFWHSHDGIQKMDGIMGSLIVRIPKEQEPNQELYDYDLNSHVMLVSDWMEVSGDTKFPGLINTEPGQEPKSYLINGRSRLPKRKYTRSLQEPKSSTEEPERSIEEPERSIEEPERSIEEPERSVAEPERSNEEPARHERSIEAQQRSANATSRRVLFQYFSRTTVAPIPYRIPSFTFPYTIQTTPVPLRKKPVPLTVYNVELGRRYRFRLIGGTCLHCPAELSIEGHRMRLIMTDGTSVEPVYFDKIIILPGERYDFVIEANQAPSSYWINVRGFGPCTAVRAYGVGVLRYAGSIYQDPPTRNPGYTGFLKIGAVTLNPIGAACTSLDNNICVTQLITSDTVNSQLMKTTADRRIVLGFDFKLYTDDELFNSGTYHRFLRPVVPVHVTAFVNKISNIQSSAPLITQVADIDPSEFCPTDASGNPICPTDFCECVHVIKVAKDAVIEMVFADLAADPGDLSHPFHLHGHKFHVVRFGRFPERARSLRGVQMLKDGILGQFSRGLIPMESHLDNTTLEVRREREESIRRRTSKGQREGHIYNSNELLSDDASNFAESQAELFMEGGKYSEEVADEADDDVTGREERDDSFNTTGSDREGKQTTQWFTSKDVVAVPSAGYAVTRFIANNPGYWMIHCHFIYHQALGMSLILQVGEPADIVQPPAGFTTCGNMVNRVDTSRYL